MSICNGDANDSPVSSRPRSVHFGNGNDEEVKVSSASVYEAQPFNNSEVRNIFLEFRRFLNLLFIKSTHFKIFLKCYTQYMSKRTYVYIFRSKPFNWICTHVWITSTNVDHLCISLSFINKNSHIRFIRNFKKCTI